MTKPKAKKADAVEWSKGFAKLEAVLKEGGIILTGIDEVTVDHCESNEFPAVPKGIYMSVTADMLIPMPKE